MTKHSLSTDSPPEAISRGSKLQSYLFSSVRVDLLVEIQLLLLTFATGIQDAISFPDFHCFASNQTGNSVVLAVGLAGLSGELFDIDNVGISLGMFLSGAIITGQMANLVGPRRRLWLVVTNLMQTVMTFATAAVQMVYHDRGTGSSAVGAIALLAFSSGAQIASMRPMRIQEITTAMATAAWIDLVVDPQLLTLKNRPRDRRALFLAALVAGSFAGAFMYKPIGSGNALIVCGATKMLVTITFLFNREERSEG